MKKTIIWILAILAIIAGGGIYLHRTSSRPQNTAAPTVKVKPKKKKIHRQPAKQSSSSNSASTYNKENKAKTSSSSSSSAAVSSSSSQAQTKQSSSSSVNTGTAGKQGAGKMGNHTVNGQTVSNNVLAQIKQQLNNLGYDANAWSPQDMINLYRSVNQNGVKTPAQITKNDVENYLHK